MTPAPVEIARKVLEAAKAAGDDLATEPFAESDFEEWDRDVRPYLAAAANGAPALARAVIELSAENERRVNALGAILLLTDEPLRCSGQPECDIVEHKVARLARAALSPTEGDGRKETNDGK